MHNKPECRLLDLGLIDYLEALNFQKKIVREVISGQTADTLLSCEHPHTITFNRRTKKENILAAASGLKKLGVGICCTDRGGDVTYHGPGQLILYPILDLKRDAKDLSRYLRKLEEVVIRALRGNFGLNALRRPGMTGVWVGPYKVASIGIGVRHWVTYHGLALNVTTDKKFFSLIKPCGLEVKMASLNDFFDELIGVETVCDMIIKSFSEVFELKIIPSPASEDSEGSPGSMDRCNAQGQWGGF